MRGKGKKKRKMNVDTYYMDDICSKSPFLKPDSTGKISVVLVDKVEVENAASPDNAWRR